VNVEITRNIIQDLLPLYLAGEVCPETSAAVEEFLSRDAGLAAEVERMKSDSLKQILTGETNMTLPQDHDAQTLARTRSTIAQRSWMIGLAIAFTLFPMSFVFDKGHIQWMLIRDIPSLAMASWAAALGFWVGFVIHNRRLRSSGL
jgi:anti-sigma factor RsiW